MEQPNVAQKGPFQHAPEEDGQVWWCACGLSQNQPFCDGSHKSTPFRPVMTEVKAGGSYWFCGCKQSGNKPMCDGTHSSL